MFEIAGGIILGFIGIVVLQKYGASLLWLVLVLVVLFAIGVALILWPYYVMLAAILIGVPVVVLATAVWVAAKPWSPQWVRRDLRKLGLRGTSIEHPPQ